MGNSSCSQLENGVLRDLGHAYGFDSHDVEMGLISSIAPPLELEDLEAACAADGSSLLYGEMLPRGLFEILRHLGVECLTGGTLLELGSGIGKLALQALLEHGPVRRLSRVVGMELAPSRHRIGVEALHRLAATRPESFEMLESDCEDSAVLALLQRDAGEIANCGAPWSPRVTLICGDFLVDLPPEVVEEADLVLLQVCLPPGLYKSVFHLLSRLKPGALILSLLDLPSVWEAKADAKTGSAYSDPCMAVLELDGSVCPVGYLGGSTSRTVQAVPTSWSPDGWEFFLLEARKPWEADTQERRVRMPPTVPFPASAMSLGRGYFCEGVQDGGEIPRGLLPPTDVHLDRLHCGMALEVACAHCLRTPGEGPRLFEDIEEVRNARGGFPVDPEDVDWLPVWVSGRPLAGKDSVDVLYEDGSVETQVAPERLRRVVGEVYNKFGPHLGWFDTE